MRERELSRCIRGLCFVRLLCATVIISLFYTGTFSLSPPVDVGTLPKHVKSVFISFLSSLILCNQIISQRKHPYFLPSVLGRKREKIMHYLSSTFVYYLIKMFKSVQVTFSCRTQVRRPMSFNSRGSNTFTCCSWFQT